jgi:C1A family cysteine protease
VKTNAYRVVLFFLGTVIVTSAQDRIAFPSGGGAKKEYPSQEKLKEVHAKATRALRGLKLELPKTQDEERLKKIGETDRAKETDKVFSWKNAGGVSPCQNQSTCGACYHFAAIGTLECNYASFHNGAQISASEQRLLNCAPGKCGDGFLSHSLGFLVEKGTSERTLEPFHIPPKVDLCNQSVAIAHKAFATDFVASDGGMPSNAAIKKAILNRGPIAVYMDADGMNGPEYQNTDVLITADSSMGSHFVIITGWDDGKGAWEIKNSWGKSWGRSGFGFVKYGIREIGYNAQWILSDK